MKLIVFQSLTAIASPFDYNTFVKMANSLNIDVASVGVNELLYFMIDDSKTFTFNFKMILLKQLEKDPANIRYIDHASKAIKEFEKSKNKISPQIVALNFLKKKLNEIFKNLLKEQHDALDQLLRVKTMCSLIDYNTFCFYPIKGLDALNFKAIITSVTKIMQLLLPDFIKGHPMFFLHIENPAAKNIINIEIHKSESNSAEKTKCFYGKSNFIFPFMTSLSQNEIAYARKQLDIPTRQFRKLLDHLTEICYHNLYTNLGLNFFRKHLKDLLPTPKNKVLETPVLKNTSDLTCKNLQPQILIGEAPIVMIWKIFKTAGSISEEKYHGLLKIKEKQFPKFEVRWPVAFFKFISDDLDFFDLTENEETLTSVKKTIIID